MLQKHHLMGLVRGGQGTSGKGLPDCRRGTGDPPNSFHRCTGGMIKAAVRSRKQGRRGLPRMLTYLQGRRRTSIITETRVTSFDGCHAKTWPYLSRDSRGIPRAATKRCLSIRSNIYQNELAPMMVLATAITPVAIQPTIRR